MLNIIKILTPLYKNELQSRGYSPPPILTEQMLNSKTEKRQEKKRFLYFKIVSETAGNSELPYLMKMTSSDTMHLYLDSTEWRCRGLTSSSSAHVKSDASSLWFA